jgi:diazepam-binding inhibitor (GABA receptor modulator, acyl-CoA-binding protein)
MIQNCRIDWSIMSDLKTAFDAAVASTQDLTQRPSNATLLKMYALYKQASQGDVSTPKPGLSDLVGRAKWDAWNQLKGTDADTAMQNYIDLVSELE